MELRDASILIVDDEPALLDITGKWFQRIVRQIFCAADGAQALEILAAHQIDLIITDVRMPVMDGITLLQKIKAKQGRTPSVIFVTGFADIEGREALDLGAEALLEKPVDYDDLVNIVGRSLLAPDERWQKTLDLSAYPVLRRSFGSLEAALREHQMAFGRGGLCMEAGQFLMEGPVNIELNFKAEGYVLSGQGIVRWVAQQDNRIGIELTYVAETSRARLIELTKAAPSFIPRNVHQYDRPNHAFY